MSDLINRQDAIEVVMNTEPVVFDVQTLEPHQKTKDVIAAIEALPSAQPEERTEERTETHTCDCISRQAAIDMVRKCNVKEVTPAYMLIDKSEIMTELMMLPSAEPEQFKSCKNCIHLGHAYMMPCKNCRRNQMMPDWYDVETERRTDE